MIVAKLYIKSSCSYLRFDESRISLIPDGHFLAEYTQYVRRLFLSRQLRVRFYSEKFDIFVFAQNTKLVRNKNALRRLYHFKFNLFHAHRAG